MATLATGSFSLPKHMVPGVWQKAQASLRFTESCLSYSINLPSNSIC